MDTANGFGEDGGDVNDLKLGAQAAVLVLGNRVGHEKFVDGGCVDPTNGVAAEDAVGNECVDHGGALSLEKLGGAGNGVGRVGDVVDEDADAIGDVTDQHHAGVALLVELDGAAFLAGINVSSEQ